MRKLIVAEMLTIDGYFSGPKGEIDWMVLDKEFDADAIALLDTADTLLFGRTTFEMMASYWPTASGPGYSTEVARRMNGHSKVGVSAKPLDLTWNNSRQLSGDLETGVRELKTQPGKNILIYGSGSLVVQLTDLGLIDEYHLVVAPVVLGQGHTLFAGVVKRPVLRLTKTRRFASGSVMHHYETHS